MGLSKFFFRLNLFVLLSLLIINFLTIVTPEIGFDALWYHLTLPKLWLLKHQWYFPGGLLYYSAMPRLTEIIYTPLIAFLNYSGPKLLQYVSGIGVGYLIFKICRQLKLNITYSLIAVSLFYATWLVSWQSGSGYIDLFRTLLEIGALFALLNGKKKIGSIMLGLAIGTKWLSIGSLLIYSLVFGISIIPLSLAVSLPWFLIAFHFTHNPVYPIFSSVISHTSPDILLSLTNLLILPIRITFPFDDFLSPVAGLLVSLSAIASITTKKESVRKISHLALLGCCLSLMINPPSSRFFLPYLPAAAITSTYLVYSFKDNIRLIFIGLFSLSAVIVLSLRLVAFIKYKPYLSGAESVQQFLTRQSSKLEGTFIDSDNYVKDYLPQSGRYLIDGLHNLYYFPYDFDHTSWVSDYDNYDYLITDKENNLSNSGNLIHTNSVGISIYKLK